MLAEWFGGQVQPVGNLLLAFDKHAHMLWTDKDYLNAESL
jgi:hypothetical protein